MKKGCILLSATALSALGITGCEKTNPDGFNVIYILADDLGIGDVGCYGQKKIHTPNIDRLASEGLLFTQHYAGCTVSAPSRSSLMTGLHTGHTPIRGNRSAKELGEPEGQYPMPEDTYTLGKMFKEAGYVTGTYGKWGLGYPGSPSGPDKMGIDSFFGYNCQTLAHKYYPEHLWDNNQMIELPGNDLAHKEIYSHDLIHEKALSFIEDNKDKKFFLFLSYTLPHAELLVPDDEIIQSYRGVFEEHSFIAEDGIGDYTEQGRSSSKYCSQTEAHATFAAMVSRLDSYVGDVVEKIKQLGLDKKTIIIFTSDNGPHHEGGADPWFFESFGQFRGCKRDMYEGGIRVPMIASCPGVIPVGEQTDHISAFWDILPTFAEMTGVELHTPIDGISFLPILLGRKQRNTHDYLYWEFHEQGGKKAVRMGDWKGVQLNIKKDPEGPIELYNLSEDIHEDHDVSAEYPEIVREIKEIMESAHTPSDLFNFGQQGGTVIK